MIEEFNIGDRVVITSSNIDGYPYFEKESKIGSVVNIDINYRYPYYVQINEDLFVWSTVRALSLLERELENV